MIRSKWMAKGMEVGRMAMKTKKIADTYAAMWEEHFEAMIGLGMLAYIQSHEWYRQKSWFGRRWIDIRCLYRSVVNLVVRKDV